MRASASLQSPHFSGEFCRAKVPCLPSAKTLFDRFTQQIFDKGKP